METSDALSLTAVTKIFKTGVFAKKVGVEDITFSVPRGEVVGLVGANGSGKSTTIKMIIGFLKATSGEILVSGKNVEDKNCRKLIGYLPENPRFQKFLTAENVLTYYGRLLGLKTDVLSRRMGELLALVNLSHARRERTQGFSKGMTQRLAIAQALLTQPPILIFDEPMSGLDPLGRREIRTLIADIHRQMPATTILFSSHILHDVEELCSSVILLKKSRLTKVCHIDELLSARHQRFEVLIKSNGPSLREKLPADINVRTSPIGHTLEIDGVDNLNLYLEKLSKAGASVLGISSHRKSLEESLFAEPERYGDTVTKEANP